MGKTFVEQVREHIGHDNGMNYAWLRHIAEQYDVKSLPEEEYKELDRMYTACMQYAFLEDTIGLDMYDVDVKKYTTNSDYRGQFFALKQLEQMFEEAENGNIDAIMFLAAAFKENYFSPGLSKYSAKWCEVGAEAGNLDAILATASNYRWGENGVYADPEKAIYWYKKAAELGSEDAVSFLEHFGSGSENYVLEMSAVSGAEGFASKWYRSKSMIEGWYKKADEGDVEAQYELARILMPDGESRAFKHDTKESIKYYEMAAEQGMIDAMFNLANAYKYGWSDLEPDAKKEFYWRKQAADAGDIEATYMLAKMYIEGKGTYDNFEEGIRCLKVVSDSNHAAKYMLNYCESIYKIEKIYQDNKDRIVPVNSDFYPDLEEDDKRYFQEYLNRLMYDMICGIKNGDGAYAAKTYIHVITLIEFAVRQSEPVMGLLYEEHTDEELDILVRRFLYHYLDSIEGDGSFYKELEECADIDEKEYRKECHKGFWNNIDNSIASVQRDFPEFMEDWIPGVMGD